MKTVRPQDDVTIFTLGEHREPTDFGTVVVELVRN